MRLEHGPATQWTKQICCSRVISWPCHGQNVCFLLPQRHPDADRPLIDFRIATLMQAGYGSYR